MPIPDAFALPESVAPRAHQDALFDTVRAGFEITLWDRVSPINGVGADYWLSRPDVPAEGDIYLIGANGHTSIFQPHHPEGGPIAPGHGESLGAAHADQIAAQRVHTAVLPPAPEVRDAATQAAVHALAQPLPRTFQPHPQPKAAPPA